MSIISRCENLKILKVIFALSVQPTKLAIGDEDESGGTEELPLNDINLAKQLANVLNDNCKELEHLEIHSVNWAFFELFVPSEKFACLLPFSYDRVELLYNKQCPVKPLSLKYVNVRDGTTDIRALELINKETVEHLVAFDWNEQFNEMVNLKSLHVGGADCDEIGHFTQLEHIRLREASDTGLRRIFESNRKLSSLVVYCEAEYVIHTIVEIGSNLKKLHVGINRVDQIYDIWFWQTLASLTQLEYLYVHAKEFDYTDCYSEDPGEVGGGWLNTNLNVEGLLLVLKTCTKLKYFRFRCYSNAETITSECEDEQIRKVVADKTDGSLYAVWFDFDYHKEYHYITVEKDR